jgi:hypothetical protein
MRPRVFFLLPEPALADAVPVSVPLSALARFVAGCLSGTSKQKLVNHFARINENSDYCMSLHYSHLHRLHGVPHSGCYTRYIGYYLPVSPCPCPGSLNQSPSHMNHHHRNNNTCEDRLEG